MSDALNLVELHNVTFGYGERVVLRDLSLTVPRGKVTALMGASGGGKTTVLRLIGGQNRAQQGQVLFDGQDVGQMDTAALYAMRRRMGMLFQFGALFTDMDVFDNVALSLARAHRFARGTDPRHRADEAARRWPARGPRAAAQRSLGRHGPARGLGAGPLPWTRSSSCTTSPLPGWTRSLWVRRPA